MIRRWLEHDRSRARSWRRVPRWARLLLVAGLTLQVAMHAAAPPRRARAVDLPAPPSLAVLRVAAAGDPVAASRAVMLWLQAFDNQPGISVPFQRLDYRRVTSWLDRVLDLDPRTQYPLLAAARVYGAVPDPARRVVMFDWVRARFEEAPNERWPWLAHAAISAKHGLRDLERALRYARAITDRATGPGVPAWARDMAVVLLQDLGEYETAVLLTYRLLNSGRVTDPHEVAFLSRKLEEIERGAEQADR